MALVDAHHHYQRLDLGYPWLDPARPQGLEGDLSAIRHDFLPADYRAKVAGEGVTKTVHVQNGCADPLAETRWVAGLGADAIVAYADLAAEDVGALLDAHLEAPQMRGIRQILNWHEVPQLCSAPRDLMEQPAWRRGFGEVARRGLSFDLQIYWPQMAMAQELAQDFPHVPLILNHFGMPVDSGPEAVSGWRQGIAQLARAPNVAVKLSGFGLCPADPAPLLSEVIRAFTPDRVVFGSNLPVDLLFAPARSIFRTLDAALAPLGPGDRDLIRHANAERIYRI